MAQLTFFIGKGGVGKTTLSAAYALTRAKTRSRARMLLVSTDPAHSLADVLQQPLHSAPAKLNTGPANLRVWQINASKEFAAFLEENREPMLQVVEQGTIFTRAEIEPFLDTALPGMAELAALLTLAELIETDEYAEIIVDTAPFGHTLRLFQLPEQFQKLLRFLDAAVRRDQSLAAHFGGRVERPSVAFLERWHTLFDRIRSLLVSPDTRVMLVSSPEPFALEQSVRIAAQLRDLGMRIDNVVLNRAVADRGSCPVCKRRRAEATKAKRFIRSQLPGVSLLEGEDPGFPIAGTATLAAFGARVFDGAKTPIPVPRPPAVRDLNFEKAAWPSGKQRLSFTLGKGGVGKTTISAGLAVAARRASPRAAVTVCSTDPAPSLDDIFLQSIGNEPVAVLGDRGLRAIEIDSLAEYEAFTRRLRQSLDSALRMRQGSVHIELTHEQEVLHALLDIMPPGVDELLGIMRISKVLEEGNAHLVVDMAPTGHALELLRIPERMLHWSRLLMKILAANRNLAIAQDIAVDVAELSQRIRSLLELMRDPKRCQLIVVLLAEPLPDRETRRLLAELKALKLPVRAAFANRVHFSAQSRCPRCASAIRWQRATLGTLVSQAKATPVFAVPEFPQEIAGKASLSRLTKELWRVQAAKPRKH